MPRSAANPGNEDPERKRGTFAVVVQDVDILCFEQPDEFIDDRLLLIRRKLNAA